MTSRTLSIAATALAIGIVALAGCETTESDDMSSSATTQTSMGMVNDTCPISGKAVPEGAPTRQYHGYTIGFCCAGCPGQWDKWSDEKKSEYLSSAMDN